MPKSPLDAKIHPIIKKAEAAQLVNFSNGIVEAYDLQRNLLGVFKQNKEDKCERLYANRYLPFIEKYKPYFNSQEKQPTVLEHFKNELAVQTVEKIIPVIKQVFHVF